MKVLSILPARSGPVGMIFARRQIEALKAEGMHIDTIELPKRSGFLSPLIATLRLRQTVTRGDYRIVHAHYGAATGLIAACATFCTGARFVITFRGSDINPIPSEPGIRTSIAHLFSNVASLLADEVICVSKEIRSRLWWKKHRVSIIPTGVDDKIFLPCPQHEARQSLGWDDTRRVILFNEGGRPEIKGAALALKSFEKCKQQIPEAELLVLSNNIPPDRMPILMAAADCILMTSDYEGSPTIVAEALACNVPVVSVDIGDVAEMLAIVSPSWVVERNADAIGNALAAALSRKHRSNGRSFVEKNIGRAATALQTMKVYNSAVRL